MKFKNRPREATRISASYKPLTANTYASVTSNDGMKKIRMYAFYSLLSLIYALVCTLRRPIFFLFQIDEMVAKRLVLRLVVTTLVITKLVIQHS